MSATRCWFTGTRLWFLTETQLTHPLSIHSHSGGFDGMGAHDDPNRCSQSALSRLRAAVPFAAPAAGSPDDMPALCPQRGHRSLSGRRFHNARPDFDDGETALAAPTGPHHRPDGRALRPHNVPSTSTHRDRLPVKLAAGTGKAACLHREHDAAPPDDTDNPRLGTESLGESFRGRPPAPYLCPSTRLWRSRNGLALLPAQPSANDSPAPGF